MVLWETGWRQGTVLCLLNLPFEKETENRPLSPLSPPDKRTKTMTLPEIRILIDQVDHEIRRLLMKRMDYSAMVAEAKLAAGDTAVYRPDREEAVLERLGREVPEDRLPEYLSVVRKIMEASRMYQYGLIYDRLEDPLGPLLKGINIPEDCRLVTVMLSRPDRPGSIAAVLSMIGDCGFDTEKLERTGGDPRSGMVTFRLQIRGDLNEARMKKLFFQLSGECEDFRILGCAGCSPEEKTAE